jgi:predicted O-methyltransferase YrrM
MNYTDNEDFVSLCKLLGVPARWFPLFDDYTATPNFLLKIATGIMNMETVDNVMECGSGISTLVIAQCLYIKGYGKLISLEHDPSYSSRTYTWLKDRGLNGDVDVHLCPITGIPPWYSLATINIPKIDLLVIDAPPAHIHTGARYGAWKLFSYLKEGALIYADDAIREDRVIKRWSEEFLNIRWNYHLSERGIAIGIKGKTKLSVLIAVPNNGYIHKHVSLALLKLQTDNRYHHRIIQPTHSPSDNNRHHIFNDFLANNEDYLLMIDSDNPPTSNPLDLIELDLDIITCPTPVWHFTGRVKGERPIYENAYKYVPEEDAYTEWPEKVGLQKVDAVGTGCILIARRVLEHKGMRSGANQRTLHADGTVNKGGDIMFCETAKKCGFEIYAHYNYRCLHFQEVELHEVTRAFGEIKKG